ncbi:MAG TPA: glycosyltransferase family 2 protein [Terriglobales bacterium]|nr:glycosyltransferase family 2 protein [Terriglobales bacterium]
MDLSIIIVNWNSEDYLRECIPSIDRWTAEVSYEVIVVDNASPAISIDSIKEQFPAIKLIKSGKNLGFSGANNIGFRESAGDYVLFLNPDTKLSSPAIDLIMKEAKRLPDAGIVGCRLLNGDLSVQTSSIMKFPRIWNSILQIEYLRLRWPQLWGIGPLFSDRQPAEVEAVSGACMLMRREVFEKIGRFSEEYFMYSEDVDLCYQAVRAGFKNYHLGHATMVHYGGKSSPGAWQTAMKTRAELRFCRRNYGRMYSVLFRMALVLNASARLTVLATVRLFARAFHVKNALDSTWLRWSVILKTLVMQRGSRRDQPVLPTACG